MRNSAGFDQKIVGRRDFVQNHAHWGSLRRSPGRKARWCSSHLLLPYARFHDTSRESSPLRRGATVPPFSCSRLRQSPKRLARLDHSCFAAARGSFILALLVPPISACLDHLFCCCIRVMPPLSVCDVSLSVIHSGSKKLESCYIFK